MHRTPYLNLPMVAHSRVGWQTNCSPLHVMCGWCWREKMKRHFVRGAERRETAEKEFSVCIYSSTHVTRSWIGRVCFMLCLVFVTWVHFDLPFAIYLVWCTFRYICGNRARCKIFSFLSVLLSTILLSKHLYIILICKDTFDCSFSHSRQTIRTTKRWKLNTTLWLCCIEIWQGDFRHSTQFQR